MSDSTGLELRIPSLGGRRGVLSDWTTQRWVQLTGKSVNLRDCPWLEGPVGDVGLIGSAFFRRLAERKNLDFVADGPGRGLLDDFSGLSGPACNTNDVDPRVAAFYENTSEFEFHIWSEWCGAFRPFGGALAAIFSRRLQQLNVPLSPLAVVEKEPCCGSARHVRTLQETIRVYADAQGTLRADHDLWIWGARFLRLHYRMQKAGGRPAA